MTARAEPGPVILVMGVSGAGKTSLGVALAARLGAPFLDGDDFHPPANRAKMASGRPLTDEDRAPWLAALGAAGARAAQAGGAVVACSALKRDYRRALRQAWPDLVLVHLTGAESLLAERLRARQGHFMPAALLASQLATLEPPEGDERAIDLPIDLEPAEQLEIVCRALQSR